MNLKEEQDKLRAEGKRLCVDCKHGSFNWWRSDYGDLVANHYCKLHPSDGFYTIHINCLSCEHPDRFCKFEQKGNEQ